MGERMDVFEKSPPHCSICPMAVTGGPRPRVIEAMWCWSPVGITAMSVKVA